MKKIVTIASALALVVLMVTARDFLVHLKSGDVVRIPLDQISEVTFDENDVILPEDPCPDAVDFTHRSLLMQHTGTGCQHCPLMVMALRELQADAGYSSSYTLAALHSYVPDPMINAQVSEISDAYRGSNGWPYLSFGFTRDGVGSNENYRKTADQIRAFIDKDMTSVVPSGIASVSRLDERTLTITLAAKAAEDGDYRVGAFLVENGIKAEQTNTHTDVTGEADFSVHNNVVRAVVGRDSSDGFTGVDLGSLAKGETGFTRQTMTLSDGWNLENCRLLIYVTERKGENYVCVNTAYAPVDGSLSFRYVSETPATDLYLSLQQTLVEVSSKGASRKVEMSLAPGADLAKVTASTAAEWISGISVESDGISFKVAPNTGEYPREGCVNVHYGDGAPISISVRQDAPRSGDDDLFRINVQVLSPYSVSVKITPDGYDGNYLFLVAQASAIDRYINAGNLEGWIEGDIEWLREQAESNALDLATFLPLCKQAYALDGAVTEITYSNLKTDTEYYIYCYGLTVDGEVTTQFHKKKFTTEIVGQADLDLTAEISGLTSTEADVTVIPSDDDVTYYWTYVSEMDWAQYDIWFIMDTMIQNIMYAVNAGADINDIIHTGPSGESIKNLWAGTKYYLVGWGMDEHGTPTTDPVQFGEFTTLPAGVVSDCSFEIEFPSVKDNDIQIHVVPTDNSVRYYVACVEESVCSGYNDDQMAQRLINMETARFDQNFYGEGKNWGNVDWVLSGEQTKWGRADLDWTFSPRHTYRVYVFGVNSEGVRTTQVARKDCTTIAPGESDMTFEVTLENSTWDYGTYHIKPSRSDEYYMPFLIETEELKYVSNPDGTLNEQMLCDEIEHFYDNTPNYYTFKGEQTLVKRWISDRDYTMLLCGWSGGNTTPFYKFETHTPKIGFGEGLGDVECDYELFDATALSELDYNRWKEYLGCVVIRLQFKPNSDAAFYCGGVWMPESNYSDTGGVDHLLTLIQDPVASIVNRPSAMYRTLNYGVTYSLSYVAKDSEGRLGPWHYVEFTPKAGENITEAYDFWSNPISAPEQILVISPDGKMEQISTFGKPASKTAAPMRVSAGKTSAPAAAIVRGTGDTTLSLGRK